MRSKIPVASAADRPRPPGGRRARRPERLRGLLALLTCLAAGATAAQGEPLQTLRAAPSRSSDGVYQLSWDAGGPVRLEESTTPDFRDPVVIYEGRDRATTVSGRTDGSYHYRLLFAGSPPTTGPAPSTTVEVSHHSLGRALIFFGVGLAVFLATVVLVYRGEGGSARA